jgi:CheY-like chemotaxis protein
LQPAYERGVERATVHMRSCQEDLRAILCDFLSASGYTVIEAGDGADSVAKAASERPDLLLMDIQLPVLDGYDATRQIKAARPCCNPDHCGQFLCHEGGRREGKGRRV